MPLPGTTGTDRQAQKQAFDISILEMSRPAAATATSGAATLNQGSGRITTEALTTGASGIYSLTLSNSVIDASGLALVLASVHNGTSTTGIPMIAAVTPGNGQAVIQVQNNGAAALSGTLVIDFVVVRKGPVVL